MYAVGDQVEVIDGEYAGLGGEVVAVFDHGVAYEVEIGGYRLPVAAADLVLELRQAARIALAELKRLCANPVVIAQLTAALNV